MSAPPTIGSQAVRGIAFESVAAATTAVIGGARMVILARLLLPEQFGVVALALAFVQTVSQFLDPRAAMGYLQTEAPDERDDATYLTIVVAAQAARLAAVLAVLAWAGRWISDAPGFHWIALAVLAFSIVESLSTVQETMIRKELRFRRLAVLDVSSSVAATLCAVSAALAGAGAWALVVERSAGIATRFALSWGPFRARPIRWGLDRERSLPGFVAFGREAWTASNVNHLANRLVRVWVGSALGAQPLGYFSKASELGGALPKVLLKPLSWPLLPLYSSLRDNREELSRLVFRPGFALVRLSLAGTSLLVALAPELIRWILGANWLPMTDAFRLLALSGAVTTLSSPASGVLFMTGDARAVRNARLAQAVVLLPAVFVGGTRFGLAGVAAGSLVASLVLLAVLGRSLRVRTSFSLRTLIAWPLVAAAVAIGPAWLLEAHAASAWTATAWKLAAWIVAFGAFLPVVEWRMLRARWPDFRDAVVDLVRRPQGLPAPE